jgi:DtxR family transcriptional regulator, Mn-dependent transcriptional regulator
MDFWKAFDHHVVAIADLIQEFGYARVSDVARMLQITRGSVSVTLKNLKQRGLVTEDERRFLGLSEEGQRIARAVRARKQVMKELFLDVLGVAPEQAEIDTCKIEHLISAHTAGRTIRFLRFIQSDVPEARAFREALARFDRDCGRDPNTCPCCDDACLDEMISHPDEETL